MRTFILVDLRTQMPYLPQEMRDWPRERVLAWLRQYGEVRELETWTWPQGKAYVFCSWVGLYTSFVLTETGQMFVPGMRIAAWTQEARRSEEKQKAGKAS